MKFLSFAHLCSLWGVLLLLSCVSGELVRLTDANFDEIIKREIFEQNKSVFLFFSAPWCGHCKAAAPTYKTLAGQHIPGVVIAKVDATKEMYVAGRFDVPGYPTFYLLQRGVADPEGSVVVKRFNGSWDVKAMAKWLEKGHKKAKAEEEEVDLFSTWALFVARAKAKLAVGDEYLNRLQEWSGLEAHWFRVVIAPIMMTIIMTIILATYGIFIVSRSYVYAWMGWPDPDDIEAALIMAKARERESEKEKEKQKVTLVQGAHGVKTVVDKKND